MNATTIGDMVPLDLRNKDGQVPSKVRVLTVKADAEFAAGNKITGSEIIVSFINLSTGDMMVVIGKYEKSPSK